MDLMKEIEEQFEQQILPKLVKDLPTISFSNIAQKMISVDKAKPENLAQAQSELDKAIQDMTKDLSKYTDYYDECENVLKDGNFWIQKKDLDRLEKMRNRLKAASDKLQNIKGGKSEDWGLRNGIAKTVNTVGGFISEYAIANLANLNLGKNINNISQNGFFKIQVLHSGIQSSSNKNKSGYRVQTSDLSIVITDTKGEIQLKLPGISLKRTSSGSQSSNRTYNIHVKSSSIGKLIANAGLGQNSAFDLNTFYNYYANNKRTTHRFGENNETVVNKVTHINQMYKAFYSAILLTAIAGSLTVDDFAYFLVINDKIFTAEEIIQKALTGDANIIGGKIEKDSGYSTLFTAQDAIRQHHEQLFNLLQKPNVNDRTQAKERSNRIIQKINKIKLTLNLKMQLNDLL